MVPVNGNLTGDAVSKSESGKFETPLILGVDCASGKGLSESDLREIPVYYRPRHSVSHYPIARINPTAPFY
jgi:hypothetical protein